MRKLDTDMMPVPPTDEVLRDYLYALMSTFELAYPLRDSDGALTRFSLVPAMLPAKPPHDFDPFGGLGEAGKRVAKMRIHAIDSGALPRDLFPRLVVRLQRYVQQFESCWFDANSGAAAGLLLSAASNVCLVSVENVTTLVIEHNDISNTQ